MVTTRSNSREDSSSSSRKTSSSKAKTTKSTLAQRRSQKTKEQLTGAAKTKAPSKSVEPGRKSSKASSMVPPAIKSPEPTSKAPAHTRKTPSQASKTPSRASKTRDEAKRHDSLLEDSMLKRKGHEIPMDELLKTWIRHMQNTPHRGATLNDILAKLADKLNHLGKLGKDEAKTTLDQAAIMVRDYREASVLVEDDTPLPYDRRLLQQLEMALRRECLQHHASMFAQLDVPGDHEMAMAAIGGIDHLGLKTLGRVHLVSSKVKDKTMKKLLEHFLGVVELLHTIICWTGLTDVLGQWSWGEGPRTLEGQCLKERFYTWEYNIHNIPRAVVAWSDASAYPHNVVNPLARRSGLGVTWENRVSSIDNFIDKFLKTESSSEITQDKNSAWLEDWEPSGLPSPLSVTQGTLLLEWATHTNSELHRVLPLMGQLDMDVTPERTIEDTPLGRPFNFILLREPSAGQILAGRDPKLSQQEFQAKRLDPKSPEDAFETLLDNYHYIRHKFWLEFKQLSLIQTEEEKYISDEVGPYVVCKWDVECNFRCSLDNLYGHVVECHLDTHEACKVNTKADKLKLLGHVEPTTCTWNGCGKVFDELLPLWEHVSAHIKKTIDYKSHKRIQKCRWKDCAVSDWSKHLLAHVVDHLNPPSNLKSYRCHWWDCTEKVKTRADLSAHVTDHVEDETLVMEDEEDQVMECTARPQATSVLKPTAPGKPTVSGKSTGTGKPTGSEKLTAAVKPTGSAKPTAPVKPAAPVKPTAPAKAIGMGKATGPNAAAEPPIVPATMPSSKFPPLSAAWAALNIPAEMLAGNSRVSSVTHEEWWADYPPFFLSGDTPYSIAKVSQSIHEDLAQGARDLAGQGPKAKPKAKSIGSGTKTPEPQQGEQQEAAASGVWGSVGRAAGSIGRAARQLSNTVLSPSKAASAPKKGAQKVEKTFWDRHLEEWRLAEADEDLVQAVVDAVKRSERDKATQAKRKLKDGLSPNKKRQRTNGVEEENWRSGR